MAVNIHPSVRQKGGPLVSGRASYRRKRGKVETKKIHRKIKLKIRHIVISFLLLAGFFYGFSRIYLFLITWEKLNVREIEIICQKEDVRRDIEHMMAGKYLGNYCVLHQRSPFLILLDETFPQRATGVAHA